METPDPDRRTVRGTLLAIGAAAGMAILLAVVGWPIINSYDGAGLWAPLIVVWIAVVVSAAVTARNSRGHVLIVVLVSALLAVPFWYAATIFMLLGSCAGWWPPGDCPFDGIR